MLIAGSSAGSEDFTPALMEELGELLVHGTPVMPGKPALLAAADAGHGIHAAAQALSLDVIRSDTFKEKALVMGGYEVHETGNVGDSI